MRWSIVRLISVRELRDLLRDRRTIFLIFALPIMLYPGIGLLGLMLSVGLVEKPSIVGISYNTADFPPRTPAGAGLSPVPVATWLALLPGGAGHPAGTVALVEASRLHWDYPPLVSNGGFLPAYFESAFDRQTLQLKGLDQADSSVLESRQIDVLLSVPPDFWQRLGQNGRPIVHIEGRDNDDRSRLASQRLHAVINQWKKRLKEVRLRRQGLPIDFDDPVEVRDAEQGKPLLQRVADDLVHLLARSLPFLIVMWSLAGALYPAIDLGAGEKERGTLETLLVSPAGRDEIVWGKFLAIWVASTATTLWNLLGLSLSFGLLRLLLPIDIIRPAAWLWCGLLVVPLSALFSAICLAVGVYARSTKEGQYYLMPLVLLTLLLTFVSLVPGVELTLFYSLVPITGVALLQQRLMTSGNLERVPWLYFVPVFASLGVCIWLALRWAIGRFHREEVLFR